MSTEYRENYIRALASDIKEAGFRVFIAAVGTHGFYTDAAGSRVVCFQYDLGGMTYGGKYRTDQPSQTGNGWRLEEGSFREMFNQAAPPWALRGCKEWRYTTLEQYLAIYQETSKFTELMSED